MKEGLKDHYLRLQNIWFKISHLLFNPFKALRLEATFEGVGEHLHQAAATALCHLDRDV